MEGGERNDKSGKIRMNLTLHILRIDSGRSPDDNSPSGTFSSITGDKNQVGFFFFPPADPKY